MDLQMNRLQSLDAFRGMTIAGMILVNTPGSWAYVYPPLLHAKWHGCTPTDLVFPFFLFIVGVSMSFSYAKFDYKWSKEAFLKLLKRTLLIFLVGLLLNAFPFYTLDLGSLRIMGVLQRIALAFGLGGTLILLLKRKYLISEGIFLLLFYGFVLWFFGGEDPYSLESNVVRSVDLSILGEAHMYKGFGIPFDPEGLLSAIPATVTVIIGFLIGVFVKEKIKTEKDLLKLTGIGLLLLLAGLLWSIYFPLNKPIWSSSYVLFTAGLATILFAAFHWLIDMKGWKKWSNFFVVFGMNPLFGFVLSVVWVKIMIKVLRFSDTSGDITTGYGWLYQQIFVPIAGNMNGSLLFAVTHIVFFWAILYILYRRKIFIKI